MKTENIFIGIIVLLGLFMIVFLAVGEEYTSAEPASFEVIATTNTVWAGHNEVIRIGDEITYLPEGQGLYRVEYNNLLFSGQKYYRIPMEVKAENVLKFLTHHKSASHYNIAKLKNIYETKYGYGKD